MIIKKYKAVNYISAFIFIIACLVLTGWALRITAFMSVTPNMTAMNPLSAVIFLIVSAWIYLENHQWEKRRSNKMQYIITALVLLTGCFKLMEYEHLISFPVDQFLFHSKLKDHFLHNAMAPTTATLFLLTGILLFNSHLQNKLSQLLQDALILIGFIIAYLGTLGYIYSLEPFYRIGPFVPMALNTAISFLSVFTALFLVIEKGNIYHVVFSEETGGKLSRRAIPFLLLIPPAFGYMRLLLQRGQFYNNEYGVALDTAFIALSALLLIYYYAKVLNKKDAERKKIVQDVYESEAKYKTLVHTLKEGVVYFDKDGTVLFYNDSFCKITGYGPEEIKGGNIVEILSVDDEKNSSYDRLNKRLSGIREDYERQILHKDGSKIWVSISASQIIKDGKPSAFFSTITDISERRKQAEDMEAFSASAAHDLNAPLARIEMMANYLLDDGTDRLLKDDIEYLKGISNTSADLRNMLKDLLTFSQIGSEKIIKSPINMKEMVEQVVVTSLYLYPGADIHIADLAMASGDASAVKHVWENLILNAFKYSSKKNKTIIDIGCNEIDGRQVYYVKDNGAGFDMSLSEKLFAPFKRLHSGFEGTGLGLPIAKRIVEKHGGKIWANAEVNKGAIFYFTL